MTHVQFKLFFRSQPIWVVFIYNNKYRMKYETKAVCAIGGCHILSPNN